MLTFRETDLLVSAELDPHFHIRREIYYRPHQEDHQDEHDSSTDRYRCGYCSKWIRRIDNFKSHQAGCAVRIITQRFLTSDFKEYTVSHPDHRMELMVPYNPERGLRMYISGPPRCGKSHLIGLLLREYVRHHPNRNIYLFSQVDVDRAIDNTIVDIAGTLNWDPSHFNRVDLDQLMETDIFMDQFRGDTNPRTGRRFGSIAIFDDIDKIPNKALQKRIDELKDAILATGRDHEYRGGDIDLIVSNHSSLGYKRTQELLNQASYVVLFPQGTFGPSYKDRCNEILRLSSNVEN